VQTDAELHQINTMKQKFVITDMRSNPRHYLGILPEYLYVVDLIAEKVNLEELYIYFLLRKIRLNESFQALADVFGIKKWRAMKIFREGVVKVSVCLEELIHWPDTQDIEYHMPYQFKNNYYRVHSIIDCYELKIQKPKSAKLQAASWSSYKHANTIKFLISGEPSGCATFLSEGFGGRITDNFIVEKSGFLDQLTPGTGVLADRGLNSLKVK
jgi:hypothetical protein